MGAELEELAMAKEEAVVLKEAADVDQAVSVPAEVLSEDDDDGDLPIEMRSRGERFHAIRQSLPKVCGAFASKIWHERKRLRLKRRKELSALKAQQPEEKRDSFKPVRQEFSLELLCGNNQFDNILIEAGQILKEIQLQASLVKENSLFMSRKHQFSSSPSDGLKLVIKRTTTESPHGIFNLIQSTGGKMILRRAKKPQKKKRESFSAKVDPEETQTDSQLVMDERGDTSPLLSILKGISQYDKEEAEEKKAKTKSAKKVPSEKKFKPTKVTWGATPPPFEKKKKRKLKKEGTAIVPEEKVQLGGEGELAEGEAKSEVRVKRKYTKRSLTEGADVSKDEVPRTKRKYTKRIKVDGGEKSGLPEVPEGDVQPVEGNSQGVEVRKKRKYTKRKKPETDLEAGDVPVTPKKRGRPKLIKADSSV